MASCANAAESAAPCMTGACRFFKGESSLWTSRLNDNSEKNSNNCPDCKVYKSGYLSLSTKANRWTPWKKRWFILTRTTIVFFRNDPDSLPHKGNEGILSLGRIIINNSGWIGLDKDRKLFSVLFPDGCKSQAFALKAETSEDLLEWITALKNALARAPSAELATGPGGLLRKDTAEPKPTEPVLKQGNTINGMPVVIYETLEVNPHLLQRDKVKEDYRTGTTDTSCSRCQETGHDSEACGAVIVFGVRFDKSKHPSSSMPP